MANASATAAVPALKDKELDKQDKILMQLMVISRELILANAARRRDLLADGAVARIFDSCSGGATVEQIARVSRAEPAKLDDVLRTLQLNGLVESYVNEKGETYFAEVAPRADQWWVGCNTRTREVVLSHGYLSPNSGWIDYGPFNGEPEARNFANAHFPGWRC